MSEDPFALQVAFFDCHRFNEVVNCVGLEIADIPVERCRRVNAPGHYNVSRDGVVGHIEVAVESGSGLAAAYGHPGNAAIALGWPFVVKQRPWFSGDTHFEGAAKLRVHMRIPRAASFPGSDKFFAKGSKAFRR